jgi:hypothetical protein
VSCHCRFYVGTWNMSGYLNENKPVRTLRDIVTQMQTAYCSTIGFEVRRCSPLPRLRSGRMIWPASCEHACCAVVQWRACTCLRAQACLSAARTGHMIQSKACAVHVARACVQYMHIPNRDHCNWLRERIELGGPYQFRSADKKLMLDRLAWSDMFETFCANKYAAAKRFGLEGAESIIPGMKALIDRRAPAAFLVSSSTAHKQRRPATIWLCTVCLQVGPALRCIVAAQVSTREHITRGAGKPSRSHGQSRRQQPSMQSSGRGRQERRDRHAAPRPPQHPRQRRAQAAAPDLHRVHGQGARARGRGPVPRCAPALASRALHRISPATYAKHQRHAFASSFSAHIVRSSASSCATQPCSMLAFAMPTASGAQRTAAATLTLAARARRLGRR